MALNETHNIDKGHLAPDNKNITCVRCLLVLLAKHMASLSTLQETTGDLAEVQAIIWSVIMRTNLWPHL